MSSGGLSSSQKIALRPGYQVPFAAAIKKAVDIQTIAVGLITDPDQAESIIAEGGGEADFVALARGVLYNPRWAWNAAITLNSRNDLNSTVEGGMGISAQYLRCLPHEGGGHKLFNTPYYRGHPVQ